MTTTTSTTTTTTTTTSKGTILLISLLVLTALNVVFFARTAWNFYDNNSGGGSSPSSSSSFSLLSFLEESKVGVAPDSRRDSSGSSVAKNPISIPREAEEKQEAKEDNAEDTEKEDTSVNYHFIVSSQCSSYQLWETLATFHSAQSVHQCGQFTWIISGCLPEGKHHEGIGKGGASSDVLTPSQIQTVIQKHFPSFEAPPRADCTQLEVNLHFTPDYSDMSVYGGPYADGKQPRYYNNPKNGKQTRSSYGNYYVFNNKPNGLLHWAKATSSNDPKESIVLIDPDFLFLTKFHLARRDFTIAGKKGDPSLLNDKDLVSPGKPAAASYGLGAQWLDFNLTHICGPTSLCTSTKHEDVHKHYSAGPPYVIHRSDVLPLAKKWTELVPPTYDEYPLLYAEMFAYSMAAAHLRLEHNLINGLFTGCMVGWPTPKRWGDAEIAARERTALADSAELYRTQLTQELASGNNNAVQRHLPATSCFQEGTPSPPPMLHYCRRYMIPTTPQMKQSHPEVTYRFFAKRRVPHSTILDCPDDNSNYFLPFESTKEYELVEGKDPDWNALVVCTIVRTINLVRYKGCQAAATTTKTKEVVHK